MAIKLAADDYRRADLHFCDPNSIHIDDAKNGRSQPIGYDAIVLKAESMILHGQQQPIVCRKIAGDVPEVVIGYTRVKAGQLIRKGYDYILQEETDEGTVTKTIHRHDPEFQIKFILTGCNDKEAFLANLTENLERNDTTPIDDAVNQRKLREQHGWKDREIARFYHCNPAKVSQYAKLLSLDDETQNLVHLGLLPVSGALDLLELPQEERATVLAQVKSDNSKKLNAAEIRRVVRDLTNSDDEAEEVVTETTGPSETIDVPPSIAVEEPGTPVRVKAKPRSPKELRAFLAKQSESEEHPDVVKKFFTQLLEFMAGSRQEPSLQKTLNTIVASLK